MACIGSEFSNFSDRRFVFVFVTLECRKRSEQFNDSVIERNVRLLVEFETYRAQAAQGRNELEPHKKPAGQSASRPIRLLVKVGDQTGKIMDRLRYIRKWRGGILVGSQRSFEYTHEIK